MKRENVDDDDSDFIQVQPKKMKEEDEDFFMAPDFVMLGESSVGAPISKNHQKKKVNGSTSTKRPPRARMVQKLSRKHTNKEMKVDGTGKIASNQGGWRMGMAMLGFEDNKG